MAGPQKRGKGLLPERTISERRSGKGTKTAALGKSPRSVEAIGGNDAVALFTVRFGDPRCLYRRTHPPRAKAAAPHRPRLGLRPGGIIDVAVLGQPIDERRYVGRLLPCPAAFAQFALEISGQFRPRRRKATNIKKRQIVEFLPVERLGRAPFTSLAALAGGRRISHAPQ